MIKYLALVPLFILSSQSHAETLECHITDGVLKCSDENTYDFFANKQKVSQDLTKVRFENVDFDKVREIVLTYDKIPSKKRLIELGVEREHLADYRNLLGDMFTNARQSQNDRVSIDGRLIGRNNIVDMYETLANGVNFVDERQSVIDEFFEGNPLTQLIERRKKPSQDILNNSKLSNPLGLQDPMDQLNPNNLNRPGLPTNNDPLGKFGSNTPTNDNFRNQLGVPNNGHPRFELGKGSTTEDKKPNQLGQPRMAGEPDFGNDSNPDASPNQQLGKPRMARDQGFDNTPTEPQNSGIPSGPRLENRPDFGDDTAPTQNDLNGQLGKPRMANGNQFGGGQKQPRNRNDNQNWAYSNNQDDDPKNSNSDNENVDGLDSWSNFLELQEKVKERKEKEEKEKKKKREKVKLSGNQNCKNGNCNNGSGTPPKGWDVNDGRLLGNGKEQDLNGDGIVTIEEMDAWYKLKNKKMPNDRNFRSQRIVK